MVGKVRGQTDLPSLVPRSIGHLAGRALLKAIKALGIIDAGGFVVSVMILIVRAHSARLDNFGNCLSGPKAAFRQVGQAKCCPCPTVQ